MRSWLIIAQSLALGLALSFALVPSHAAASPPELESAPSGIVGGSESEPCEWPSVVALETGGLCTATLVHPRVIVYAAHCGTLHTHALFGEDVAAPAREVPILRCERFSDLFAVSSMDYAYCELAEPVVDVAITPLLFGCNEDLIAVGTPVTIVGFGDSSTSDPQLVGIKHAATTEIVGFLSTVAIGGMGVGADSGDSGGPAFVELDDGSWRVLGIVSGGGGGDGATVQYVPAPNTVAWIEDRSGIDITPCHDPDGSWASTPACADMFVSIDPGASWAEGCPGPRSPASDQCGPAWTEVEDDEGPSVAFVEPIADSLWPTAPVEIDVVAEAVDLGVGVRELRLLVDGVAWIDGFGQAAVDEVPPYRFEGVSLAIDGVHTLTLEARDQLDNLGTASIMISLGDDDPTSGTDTGGMDSETGTDAGGDTGTAEPSEIGPGCGCRSSPARGWGGLGLALLLGLGLGRRSGRRSGR